MYPRTGGMPIGRRAFFSSGVLSQVAFKVHLNFNVLGFFISKLLLSFYLIFLRSGLMFFTAWAFGH